jgi:hypothetical protein
VPLDEDERAELEVERWSSRPPARRSSKPGNYRVRRIPPTQAPPAGADVASRISLGYALRTSTVRIEALQLVAWVLADDERIEATSAPGLTVEDVAAHLPQLGTEERGRLIAAVQCDAGTPLSGLTKSQRERFTSALLELRYRQPT